RRCEGPVHRVEDAGKVGVAGNGARVAPGGAGGVGPAREVEVKAERLAHLAERRMMDVDGEQPLRRLGGQGDAVAKEAWECPRAVRMDRGDGLLLDAHACSSIPSRHFARGDRDDRVVCYEGLAE